MTTRVEAAGSSDRLRAAFAGFRVMKRRIAPSRRATEITILLGSNAPCGLLLGVLKAGSRRFTPFVAMLQSSHSGQSYHPSSG